LPTDPNESESTLARLPRRVLTESEKRFLLTEIGSDVEPDDEDLRSFARVRHLEELGERTRDERTPFREDARRRAAAARIELKLLDRLAAKPGPTGLVLSHDAIRRKRSKLLGLPAKQQTMTAFADILGVHPRTLRRSFRALGIDLKAVKTGF